MDITYGAAQFKAHCLQIIEQVAKTGQEVRISKRGKSLVRVLPDLVSEPKESYGFMKGSAQIRDDLFRTGEIWDADHD